MIVLFLKNLMINVIFVLNGILVLPTIKFNCSKCNLKNCEFFRIKGYSLEIENKKKVLNYNFYCFEYPLLN